jgi:hypothetical protein
MASNRSKHRRRRAAIRRRAEDAADVAIWDERKAELARDFAPRPVLPTARKRYSLAELLKGSEAIKQLNADVAWARA